MKVTMVGGPRNGETVEVNYDTRVIRVAVPVDMYRLSKPPRARRWTEPSFDIVEYSVYGNEARWEGMIGDAYTVLNVTAEALFDPSANTYLRRVLRAQVAEAFQRLAPDKQVDRRKIWRADYNAKTHMVTYTAFVGPRRVRTGLGHRQRRRFVLT